MTYTGKKCTIFIGVSVSSEIWHLLDLTKPYHNLLGMVKGDDARNFYWDGSIAAMAEKDELHYYLQDELGSPVRVSGYDKDYLTYGYDEFGNGLYHDMEEAGIPNPYSRQGEEQPFGYTGYQYDNISGTYFAQAREYQPETGRFTAEDVIKGSGSFPETLNRYGYCWGNPVGLVDNNGKIPLSNTSVLRWLVEPFPISRAVPTITDAYVGTYDEKGQELINRYLYGDGSPYVIDNDESWSDYMMSNKYLTVWTGRYLAPIGQNLEKGESIEVDMQISMRVENSNYKTGYMLIYGSNDDVGGYQIQGTVSKGLDNTIVYDLDYTFNDKMDENFRYLDDRIKYAGARALQFLSNDITLNVYDFQVSWTDTTIIYADRRVNEGWLANMELVNFDSEYNTINNGIKWAENHWWAKRDVAEGKLTKKTFEQMQNYMRSHPEYYGCFAE